MINIIKEKIEWHTNRLLSKLNYVVHTLTKLSLYMRMEPMC